ncbi:hypothetical protein [Neptuniibacter sp. QD37_11]|uniref:hypothetical protein n=1 Tax=Neptuniibacter sp. QD37_11 TaxID=3398209 RepID=UPI0039F5C6B6
MKVLAIVGMGALGLLFAASSAFAHPKIRDGNGGHVGANGAYHCHASHCELPSVGDGAEQDREEMHAQEAAAFLGRPKTKTSEQAHAAKKDGGNSERVNMRIGVVSDKVLQSTQRWELGESTCDRKDVEVLNKRGLPRSEDRCQSVANTWVSELSGKSIQNNRLVQVESLIPIDFAIKRGAHRWNEEQLRHFFLDDKNLLVIEEGEMYNKEEFLFKQRLTYSGNRCDIAARWLKVHYTYKLHLPKGEFNYIRGVLQRCK